MPRSNDRSPRNANSRRIRLVLMGCVGLSLTGAAYQAAFATSPDSPVQVMGVRPRYNPGSDSDDDGIGGGKIAAIAGGGAVVAAGGLYAAGIIGGGAAGALLTSDRLAILPADEYRVAEMRVVPRSATVNAGDCRSYFAEGRSEKDGKWYSLTNRPETTFTLKDPSSCVVKQDGSKNVFCVPITAPADCDGKTLTIVASFAPANGTPASAEGTLTVRIPNR